MTALTTSRMSPRLAKRAGEMLANLPSSSDQTPRKKIKAEEEEKSIGTPEKLATTLETFSTPGPASPKTKRKYNDIVPVGNGDNNATSTLAPRWQVMLDRLKSFRAKPENIAPVDTMGCTSLADGNVPEKVKRYQILCSLQLSSQTKDPITAQAIENLKQTPSGGLIPENIAAMDPAVLNACIAKVGFHNTKTKSLQATARRLLDAYDGDIPHSIEELLTLPGIGPKMAYLAMQCAWGENVGIGVDTHVHRIANRMGWVRATRLPEDTRKELESWLPKEHWASVNSILVGLGQTVCLPQRPQCLSCPVSDLCPKINLTVTKKSLSPSK